MRFRKYLKHESGLKQCDIAPLIDVVFILLTFFMLTAQFVVQPGVKIDLPEVSSSKGVTVKRVVVMVSAEDIIYLNNNVITSADLEKFLEREKDNVETVFIKADLNSGFGRVMTIWDICKRVGLTHVNIGTSSSLD